MTAADRRTRILDAAEELFAVDGFDATPTARVAETAKVPKGLVFYYFPRKIDLLLSLLQERLPTPTKDTLAGVVRRGDWPDLLLIDGGKGQLSAVCETLEDAGVHDVPVVSVAKGPDRNAGREIFHLPGGREITLPPNSPTLFYLQRLRDEAHRDGRRHF